MTILTATGSTGMGSMLITLVLMLAVDVEQQGRKVLDDLIYDLNSRGYSSLIIKDNGDVCIRQGDVEKAQTSFKNLPEKHYWPRLLKVFEREGIAASMTDDAIALNW